MSESTPLRSEGYCRVCDSYVVSEDDREVIRAVEAQRDAIAAVLKEVERERNEFRARLAEATKYLREARESIGSYECRQNEAWCAELDAWLAVNETEGERNG